MNVSNISVDKALSEGSEIWIIKNDPTIYWWSFLDFHSHYLFSQNFFKSKKETPQELQNIIAATSLNIMTKTHLKSYILLGTEDHFLNKWTLVWNNLTEAQLADTIIELAEKLKFKSVRFFSHSSEILKHLETRQTASSFTITCIEKT